MGERGDLRLIADALAGTAVAATAWRQPEQATRLLGAAEALRERFGGVVSSTDGPAYDRAKANVEAALGLHRCQSAWLAGRKLSLVAAIAEAQALGPDRSSSRKPLAGADAALTQRERDVLVLLAEGRTDREIADALFISVRTVDGHVARLLAKLGVPTRTAAARTALAANLVAPDVATHSQ